MSAISLHEFCTAAFCFGAFYDKWICAVGGGEYDLSAFAIYSPAIGWDNICRHLGKNKRGKKYRGCGS